MQNFSNKILILIDGRSVYSPLFSGVAYDMQDVLMDDIDRIEVISGPGATLWGANAMNGVINIITRKARGHARRAACGWTAAPEEQAAALRYGGDIGDDGAFRVYAKWFDRGATELAERRQRRRRLEQAAGRLPHGRRRAAENRFTVQGDYQDADAELRRRPATCGFNGANVLGRWEHAGERVNTRVQVFFDRVDRDRPPSGTGVRHRHLRFRFAAERRSSARATTWSGDWAGATTTTTRVNNDLAFVPDHRTLELTNVFVQDTITLSEELKLTAGIKFEDNSYSDWSALPDLRLSWAPNDKTLFWLAGSRAIRAPTPFDTDVQEFVGGQLSCSAIRISRPRRSRLTSSAIAAIRMRTLSLSASVFYNEYDDLRTIEITPVAFLPLRWGNLMEGSAYGFEAWAEHSAHCRGGACRRAFARCTSDWSSARARRSSWACARRATIRPRATTSSPRWICGGFTFDAMVRNVGALPDPALDDYTELNARVRLAGQRKARARRQGLQST